MFAAHQEGPRRGRTVLVELHGTGPLVVTTDPAAASEPAGTCDRPRGNGDQADLGLTSRSTSAVKACSGDVATAPPAPQTARSGRSGRPFSGNAEASYADVGLERHSLESR